MILAEAMEWVKVRGYIARESKPEEKYWRNTMFFRFLPTTLKNEDDLNADDWQTYDPEADENPLMG
jgi:hypothetical protein